MLGTFGQELAENAGEATEQGGIEIWKEQFGYRVCILKHIILSLQREDILLRSEGKK